MGARSWSSSVACCSGVVVLVILGAAVVVIILGAVADVIILGATADVITLGAVVGVIMLGAIAGVIILRSNSATLLARPSSKKDSWLILGLGAPCVGVGDPGPVCDYLTVTSALLTLLMSNFSGLCSPLPHSCSSNKQPPCFQKKQSTL